MFENAGLEYLQIVAASVQSSSIPSLLDSMLQPLRDSVRLRTQLSWPPTAVCHIVSSALRSDTFA